MTVSQPPGHQVAVDRAVRKVGILVALLLSGLGLTILSVAMWVVAAALGAVLATRRLAGLGLR